MQGGLFTEYLDPIKLKEGKTSCPCCFRPMKAFGYNLNEDMVRLAGMIYRYCKEHNVKWFRSDAVFTLHKDLTQFQKLKYFKLQADNLNDSYTHTGIINRFKGGWILTDIGKRFLERKQKLPVKVWAFRNKTILLEDKWVWVDEVVKDWKHSAEDFLIDYIPVSYELQPILL